MKKLTIVLLVVLCFVLSACGTGGTGGGKFSKHTFDYFGSAFSWNFSMTESENFIKEHQINKAEVKRESRKVFEGKDINGTDITDGYYRFIYDGDNFVGIIVKVGSEKIEDLNTWYGNYDKKSGEKQSLIYTWYGTMDNKNTEMWYMPYSGTLHFDKK